MDIKNFRKWLKAMLIILCTFCQDCYKVPHNDSEDHYVLCSDCNFEYKKNEGRA